MHARAFERADRHAEWLFLNVDATLFQRSSSDTTAELSAVCNAAGLAPHQIVIEVLDGANQRDCGMEKQLRALKEAGFLIALDNFGAGHSNFDRVFQLAPDIVKLDRSVIVRASLNSSLRSVTAQMVSLLHECGALVLMEGIEQHEEALVALDCSSDLVQGVYFAGPEAAMTPRVARCAPMDDLWLLCDERWVSQQRNYGVQVGPYIQALEMIALLLRGGAAVAEACATFLSLPDAQLCYLLDEHGQQIGPNLTTNRGALCPTDQRFLPLHDASDARWSRRAYFRGAVEARGKVHVTRPYFTMQSLCMCVTLSATTEIDGKTVVVCGDVTWQND